MTIDIEKLASESGGTKQFGGWYLNIESLTQFAAKVLEDKERENAEHKSQINELKSLLIDARDDVAAQLDVYQELLPYKQYRYDAQKNTLDEIDKALSKTPAQSLIEHDNEVIERCAKVCDELVIEVSGRSDLTVDQCAKTIRALKGKQNE